MKRYMAFLLCMLICAGCASSDERPMEIEMDLSKIHFDTSEKDVDLSYMMSKGQCYFYNGIYYICTGEIPGSIIMMKPMKALGSYAAGRSANTRGMDVMPMYQESEMCRYMKINCIL